MDSRLFYNRVLCGFAVGLPAGILPALFSALQFDRDFSNFVLSGIYLLLLLLFFYFRAPLILTSSALFFGSIYHSYLGRALPEFDMIIRIIFSITVFAAMIGIISSFFLKPRKFFNLCV